MVHFSKCAVAAAMLVQGAFGGMSEKGMKLFSAKQQYWAEKMAEGTLPRTDVKSALRAPQVCPEGGGSVTINGEAFPCLNVDFQSFISLSDLNINGRTSAGADIWGWTSPDNRHITIMCVDNGVWFIDVTDPTNPKRLANMPSGREKDSWCDVKVYKNTAYVVKDGAESTATRTYGIEVFNLNRLNGLTGSSIVQFTPDFVYRQHGRSHNLITDNDSGFLYSVGTTSCSGGLHIVKLEPNPLQPTFEACVSSDGYTHDAQCVVYSGPDTRFTGKQICFAYNEDTLTIWDVTNKQAVTRLARKGYPTAQYTHQGSLTADMKYILLDDELDELDTPSSVPHTRTYVVDVTSLTAPVFVSKFDHPEVSIDHNLYFWGNLIQKNWDGSSHAAGGTYPSDHFAYLSNYVSGIRILDVANPLAIKQAGFFDVAPDISGNIFEGTWSNFMHPDGTLSVSSIDRGLFVLKPKMAFDPKTTTPAPTSTPRPTLPGGSTPAPTLKPTASPSECHDKNPSGLVYSNTGNPAPCNELFSYCNLAIVQDACPALCGICEVACADKVPSGLHWVSTGADAYCSELSSYCLSDSRVLAACPATCGKCDTLISAKDVDLGSELPNFIEDPKAASARARMMGLKEGEWNALIADGKLPRPNTISVKGQPANCVNGQAIVAGEVFPCEGIDFLSFMSLDELFISGKGGTSHGSDIWGWESPSGKKVAIMCVDNGVNFVDASDPANPVRMAFALTSRIKTSWCDTKVYKDTAYVVKDSGSAVGNGIEVFDLLRLETADPADFPINFAPDFIYQDHGNSHNLVINAETGFLYSVGTHSCGQGLHIIDLSNRLEPVFAGCASSDGYTHDAQCVVYTGPDAAFVGKEICFAFNEDTLTIWDVTNKASPAMLSRVPYAGSAYTHQGWLLEGFEYLLLNDELDEMDGIVEHTRTHIWDVSELTNPFEIGHFDHEEVSIDHNLYVWGSIHKHGFSGGVEAMDNPPATRYAYLSNYVAGIKVLDLCTISQGTASLKGKFDVAPDKTGNLWEGTWSNFMFSDGTLAVSSIDRGLFFLKPNMAFDTEACPVNVPPTPFPTASPVECADPVHSGIKFADGRDAECADLGAYCEVYPIVEERCPYTCGVCRELTCEDQTPSGLFYVSGQPAPCNEIGIYCTLHPDVPVHCPETCGLCAKKASFEGDSTQQLAFTVPSPIIVEKSSGDSQVITIVAGVLAVACVGMAAALIVMTRRGAAAVEVSEVKAMTVPEESSAPPRASMKKASAAAPTSNPMFDA